MCKVIICANQKGGVAKSTSVVNLGIGLANKGKRVLVIDNDPQGSLTEALGYPQPDKLEITLANVMEWVLNEDDYDLKAGILHHEEGIDLMPANIELSGVETSLVGIMSSETTLREYIETIRDDYDYILLDTTTGFTGISLAILEQTDVLCLPCVVDFIPSIKDLKIGLDTLHKLQFDYQRVRLILNRNKAETQISTKDVEALLGRPFQYFISNDYQGIMQSIKEAKPVVLTEAKNKLADEISDMVSEELGEKEESSGGISGWFGSLFK